MELFNRCPMQTKGSSNNSNNFKNIVQIPGFIMREDEIDKSKIDKQLYFKLQQNLRMIHYRIEEKFKDYRQAYRNFDLNFDGSLSF